MPIKCKYFNLTQWIFAMSVSKVRDSTVAECTVLLLHLSLTVLPCVCVVFLRVLGLQLTVPGSTC